MIGLQTEIELRKKSKFLDRNEQLTYVNLSKIINKPYNTVKRKVENGAFTVEEALKIYRNIGFKSKNDLEAFEYLFTNWED